MTLTSSQVGLRPRSPSMTPLPSPQSTPRLVLLPRFILHWHPPYYHQIPPPTHHPCHQPLTLRIRHGSTYSFVLPSSARLSLRPRWTDPSHTPQFTATIYHHLNPVLALPSQYHSAIMLPERDWLPLVKTNKKQSENIWQKYLQHFKIRIRYYTWVLQLCLMSYMFLCHLVTIINWTCWSFEDFKIEWYDGSLFVHSFQ